MLSRALVERGHTVRGTTRDPRRRSEIEAAGAQCVVGDPDRVGTLVSALDHVSVLVLLLGCAEGSSEKVAELHGPRLEMLLSRTTDSPIRAIVYEAHGTTEAKLLREGAELVRAYGARTLTPTELIEADPAQPEGWLRAALMSVERALDAR